MTYYLLFSFIKNLHETNNSIVNGEKIILTDKKWGRNRLVWHMLNTSKESDF